MTVETVGRETAGARIVTLPARPEPIRVNVDETAVIVIDMQNAYASPGGYLDLAGFDIAGAAQVIEQSAKVLAVARAAGMPVIYFQNGWDPDYVEAGGPGSPNWHKSNALEDDARPARAAGQAARPRRLGLRAGRGPRAAARRHPSCTRPRYSGFFNSQLDSHASRPRHPQSRLRRHRHATSASN